MVKFLSVIIATLAAISPVVQAFDCKPGRNYCGSALKRNGWSDKRLQDKSLYHCDAKDKVTEKQFCSYYCLERKPSKNDICTYPE
ncbi:hypothetical protein E4U60_002977 [Claviceps pazoutovae]|uniref:Uncharacterized protein n=1 Tax=Claviceps pazoutovae TaxID=1649127 RepID=A0A9P7MAU9_9HYPO|nr:hypothetical protein E4U60_002977 [Claviceps pazoutovae]